MGRTKKRLSLRLLARFTSLRRLCLEGRAKDIGVVSQLTSLPLPSITPPGLARFIRLPVVWAVLTAGSALALAAAVIQLALAYL